MNRQPTVMALPESSCSWRLILLAGAIGLLLLLRAISVQAAEQTSQPVAPPGIVPAPPYIYSYVYPPAVGLSFYLGRPWIYGGPYYRPYWRPHFHGHWRHHR